MTLVISLTTQQVAIQVSDLQITAFDSGDVMKPQVKTVLVANQMAFGYCGLAQLDGMRTDFWLAKQICDLDGNLPPNEMVIQIASRADLAIRRSGAKKSNRRLGFSGVGFWPSAPDGLPIQVACEMHNFYDRGKHMPHLRPKMKTRLEFFKDNRLRWHAIGLPQTPQELKRLHRRLSHYHKHWASVKAVVELLAHEIRSIASRSSTVGKNLLVTVIQAGEPPICTYMPENSYDEIAYAPAVGIPGEIAMGGFTIKTGDAALKEIAAREEQLKKSGEQAKKGSSRPG